MNFITKPYFADKAWEQISKRDLAVIEKKANFFTYAKAEALLAALCVAQVVELVVRSIFAFAIVPYYFVRGDAYSLLYYRLSIMRTAVSFAMTGKALYHNLFSKYTFLSYYGPMSRCLGGPQNQKLIEIFSDLEKNKEEVTSILKWISGVEEPKAPEQVNATNP